MLVKGGTDRVGSRRRETGKWLQREFRCSAGAHFPISAYRYESFESGLGETIDSMTRVQVASETDFCSFVSRLGHSRLMPGYLL